jgi:hypothetical protein
MDNCALRATEVTVLPLVTCRPRYLRRSSDWKAQIYTRRSLITDCIVLSRRAIRLRLRADVFLNQEFFMSIGTLLK